MSEENKFQKRQTAFWVDISELIGGALGKDKDREMSVYRTSTGLLVSRVNLFGIVLTKESNDFFEGITIDDGTGKINVRSFEKKVVFDNIGIEDFVNVIGKIRMYSGVPFVSAEIVKKTSKELVSLRKEECPLVKKFYSYNEKESSNGAPAAVSEEVIMSNDGEKIIEAIRKMDGGDGVGVEALAGETGINNVEVLVKDLLSSGDVFEIRPGMLKVLD